MQKGCQFSVVTGGQRLKFHERFQTGFLPLKAEIHGRLKRLKLHTHRGMCIPGGVYLQ